MVKYRIVKENGDKIPAPDYSSREDALKHISRLREFAANRVGRMGDKGGVEGYAGALVDINNMKIIEVEE